MNTEIKPSQAPARESELTAQIVSAYVGNNQCQQADLPKLINTVYAAISGLDGKGAGVAQAIADRDKTPAVPVKKSVTPDFIVCLEDGKRLKMLKRYLRSHYDMSPEQYRAKWGLPHDYPMCAPNYAKQRSDFAKSFGLGRRAAPPPDTAKQGRGRREDRLN
jgi:predicted transcriptional regulator